MFGLALALIVFAGAELFTGNAMTLVHGLYACSVTMRDLAVCRGPNRARRSFLTTQYLEEADQLASRVAVIDGGTIIADGTPTELNRRAGSGHIVLELPTPDQLDAAARMLPTATVDSDALSLRVAGSTDANTIRDTLVRLADAQVPVANLRIVTPDLDDVFFALTGAPRAKENHE